MTFCIRCTAVILFVTSVAAPAWSQQYLLYSPQPVESEQAKPAQEGVLVQEIQIKKGDTLYGLSRKFNGKGTYYPQILLFNTIKNPNLIYAGNTLRIPLSHHKKPALATEVQKPAVLEAPVATPPAELQPAPRIRTSSAVPVPTQVEVPPYPGRNCSMPRCSHTGQVTAALLLINLTIISQTTPLLLWLLMQTCIRQNAI